VQVIQHLPAVLPTTFIQELKVTNHFFRYSNTRITNFLQLKDCTKSMSATFSLSFHFPLVYDIMTPIRLKHVLAQLKPAYSFLWSNTAHIYLACVGQREEPKYQTHQPYLGILSPTTTNYEEATSFHI
jgi:hypothetical protein